MLSDDTEVKHLGLITCFNKLRIIDPYVKHGIFRITLKKLNGNMYWRLEGLNLTFHVEVVKRLTWKKYLNHRINN